MNNLFRLSSRQTYINVDLRTSKMFMKHTEKLYSTIGLYCPKRSVDLHLNSLTKIALFGEKKKIMKVYTCLMYFVCRQLIVYCSTYLLI